MLTSADVLKARREAASAGADDPDIMGMHDGQLGYGFGDADDDNITTAFGLTEKKSDSSTKDKESPRKFSVISRFRNFSKSTTSSKYSDDDEEQVGGGLSPLDSQQKSFSPFALGDNSGNTKKRDNTKNLGKKSRNMKKAKLTETIQNYDLKNPEPGNSSDASSSNSRELPKLPPRPESHRETPTRPPKSLAASPSDSIKKRRIKSSKFASDIAKNLPYKMRNTKSTPNLLQTSTNKLFSASPFSKSSMKPPDINLYSGSPRTPSARPLSNSGYIDDRLLKKDTFGPSAPGTGGNLSDMHSQSTPVIKRKRKYGRPNSNQEPASVLDAISPLTSANTSKRPSRSGTVRSEKTILQIERDEVKTQKLSKSELEDIEKEFEINASSKVILDDIYNTRYDQSSASSNDEDVGPLSGDAATSEIPTSLPKTELNTNAIEKLPFFNEALSTGVPAATGGFQNDLRKASNHLNLQDKFQDGPDRAIFDHNTRVGSVIYNPNPQLLNELEVDNQGSDRDSKHHSTRSIRGVNKLSKTSNILLILFAALFVAAVSIFIPLIVILYRGTESAFNRYFDSQPPHSKAKLLDRLNENYNQNIGNESLGFYQKFPSNVSKSISPSKGHNLFGLNNANYYSTLNTHEGLPEFYRNDKELTALMKNGALKTAFYGIDYAPMNVIHPFCGTSEREIMLDLALSSQVTTRIRTYGMQCDQQSLILESSNKLNLNMTLAVGVWIGSDDAVNTQQSLLMKETLKKYPRKYFDSIYVGNEVLFREEKTSSEVAKYIKDVRKFIREELKWEDLPVGVSEIGSKIDTALIEASDMVGANIHPFFGGEPVNNATDWVFDFLQTQVEPSNFKAKSPANMILSEVGWPSGGGKYRNSVAGTKELQSFLDEWICAAQKSNYAWFWFEAFDEPWKKIYHSNEGTWETQWGSFSVDRKLKPGITLPKCKFHQ